MPARQWHQLDAGPSYAIPLSEDAPALAAGVTNVGPPSEPPATIRMAGGSERRASPVQSPLATHDLSIRGSRTEAGSSSTSGPNSPSTIGSLSPDVVLGTLSIRETALGGQAASSLPAPRRPPQRVSSLNRLMHVHSATARVVAYHMGDRCAAAEMRDVYSLHIARAISANLRAQAPRAPPPRPISANLGQSGPISSI